MASGIENGHHYIDLGLPSGIKWADRNIGARDIKEFGNYFAWGEIETKSKYDWDNYICGFTNEESGRINFTKYCTESENGFVDNETELHISDDVASQKWGDKWRIPCLEHFIELIKYTKQLKVTNQHGFEGIMFYGSNDNSIFFPAAGYCGDSVHEEGSHGYYWSSTLLTGVSYVAHMMQFDFDHLRNSSEMRYLGCSVRPIFVNMNKPLNRDSLQRIRNIEIGFRNYPDFSTYDIRNYCYDLQNGVQALEVSRNGRMINLFLFYSDMDGKIDSIALYGSNLQEHYNVMSSSMMCFGMRITSIDFVYGQSVFLDIYLDY